MELNNLQEGEKYRKEDNYGQGDQIIKVVHKYEDEVLIEYMNEGRFPKGFQITFNRVECNNWLHELTKKNRNEVEKD